MPRKIRELVRDLKRANFAYRGGRGSHRNFVYKGLIVTISGHDGDDAKHYQEREVQEAIRRSQTSV